MRAFDFKKAYWAARQDPLPSEYRRVEYLESTGEQWIDTGVPPYGKEPTTHIVFYPTTNQVDNSGIFGVYGASDTRYQIFRGGYTADVQYNGSVALGTYQDCNIAKGIMYDVIMDAHNKVAKVNDVLFTGFNTDNGFADYNLEIFHRNNTTDKYAIMRLYSCEIVGYRNLIPCVRIADNKPGLYDLCGSICPLTGTSFYINSGTGADFLWGELS